MATAAILNYVSANEYPDSESISSTNLSSNDLSSLLSSLRQEQSSARASIRSLSASTAPDLDEWISQARTLQADILRSRQTARDIVAEAERSKQLKEEVEDRGKKVGLLEGEVAFNEELVSVLEEVQGVNALLERAEEDAADGDVEGGLRRLGEAEAAIASLDGIRDTKVVEVLRQRAERLKASAIEVSTEAWDAIIAVNSDERKITVRRRPLRADVPTAVVEDVSLELVVTAVKGLGVFDNVIKKLGRDFISTIVKPRMLDLHGEGAKIVITSSSISAKGATGSGSLQAVFEDSKAILEFVATRLPSDITVPLSEHLIPAWCALLEEHWLDRSIPTTLPHLNTLDREVFDQVEALAEQIEAYGWHNADVLREFVDNAPRNWITKRREAVLGDVRNLVFSGLRERKVVERVETRTVSKEDRDLVGGGEGGNDWDTEWDESEPTAQAAPSRAEEADIEDASAWDVDDEPSSAQDEDEDAWGAWDENDEQASQLPSPVATRRQPQQPAPKVNGDTAVQAEQEMTLRETFTCTTIPDGILSALQTIISDAETLSSPENSSTSLAPAAPALYTLPTLALAIYRATAPTAYSKLDVGNMLIYNDALRLAELLRSWSESRPAGAGRLRLDNDLAALESFAKKTYSSEMESQRTILRDLLDGAQGFGNCTVQPFKQEAESAVEGTVARLRNVHALWKDILSQGALLQSLGSLLSTVTTKMSSEIEDLGDISEPESHQLHALCTTITDIKDLFTQPPDEGGQQEGAGEGRDMTFVYSPTWLKFQYLAEILESSLADVRWMWKEGELKLEFEAQEVVELVEALFAESELRRGAVREILGR